jgi:ribosomal protein L11 methyltransferase
VRIGRRLLVRPSWVRAPAPGGAATVTLDPGMAFGTGRHPTTRLCLEALVRHLGGGERVLDVGTGSGILAIAAAKLGAGHVLALDTDGLARRIARDNARRNGVAGRVQVPGGRLAAAVAAAGAFDVVVANLTAQDLGRLLPWLARRVRPGGLAVLSGILRGQGSHVRRAARAAGLGWPLARRRAEWVALEARRPAGRGGRLGGCPREAGASGVSGHAPSRWEAP